MRYPRSAWRIDLVGGEAAGKDTASVDPRVRGRRLCLLLEEGPPRLLVLDDVWERDQLEPFLKGGKGCAWLVTTRNPELAHELNAAVAVDHMSVAQARELLTAGLPDLDSAVLDGLLEVTGRWPLLLRLVNKILTDYAAYAGRRPRKRYPHRARSCSGNCGRAVRRWSGSSQGETKSHNEQILRGSGPRETGPRLRLGQVERLT